MCVAGARGRHGDADEVQLHASFHAVIVVQLQAGRAVSAHGLARNSANGVGSRERGRAVAWHTHEDAHVCRGAFVLGAPPRETGLWLERLVGLLEVGDDIVAGQVDHGVREGLVEYTCLLYACSLDRTLCSLVVRLCGSRDMFARGSVAESILNCILYSLRRMVCAALAIGPAPAQLLIALGDLFLILHVGKCPEPWSDSLTANPGQRLTVPDSLTALTALSLIV